MANIIPVNNEKHKVPLIVDSGSKCSWQLLGDMIVKHLNCSLADNWFSLYKQLREYEPRLVEVYEYRDNKLYMEYIDGLPLIVKPMDQFKQNVTLERYNEAIDIMRNIGQWNLENNMCFINHALQLRNFMVENRTGKIYMIDPDSFMVHDENSSS